MRPKTGHWCFRLANFAIKGPCWKT